MQIKYGTWRVTILFPLLGIAVKFPHFQIGGIFYLLKRIVTGDSWYFKGWRYRLKIITGSRSYQLPHNLASQLFNGICDNYSERKFWKKTHHTFAWPTYFSFFGFFNIQPLGIPTKRNWKEVWQRMKVLTNEDVYGDPHCFSEGHNFCEDDAGTLYCLDYASKESQAILEKWGSRMQKEF